MAYCLDRDSCLKVFDHREKQKKAYFISQSRGVPDPQSWQTDWAEAERIFEDRLRSQLECDLGKHWAKSGLLAQGLMRIGRHADDIWQNPGSSHSTGKSGHFLAGLGAELIGGPRGSTLVQNLYSFCCDHDTARQRAYAIYKARGSLDGQDRDDWRVAEFLHEVTAYACRVVGGCPDQKDFVQALGPIIIRNPVEVVMVLYPHLA